MKRKATISLLSLIAITTFLGALASPVAAQTFPHPAMEQMWERTDLPVSNHTASRTWMWGPDMFASANEAYAQAPGGMRQVAYFDKSRMEINNPMASMSSQWFITNGLLCRELITGQVQTGDNAFEGHNPAMIPIAGDPDDTLGPTYASMAGLMSRQANQVGAAVNQTVDRNGNTGTGGPGGVSYSYHVPETNHAVANVFWDFLNSSGPVFGEPGMGMGMNRPMAGMFMGKLFEPTFYATGLPITEPYWSQVKVGGQTKWVLIQCFERRILTYTPDNPEGWKVEMGNIGRHYHDWRYSNQ